MFEIGPRITAIVMLISIDSHGFYIIFGSIFHWMVMMTVAFFKNVKVYHNKLHNILFIVFISFVQIISYMNLSRGKSLLLAIAYYSLFYVENAVMVVLFVLGFYCRCVGGVLWDCVQYPFYGDVLCSVSSKSIT